MPKKINPFTIGSEAALKSMKTNVLGMGIIPMAKTVLQGTSKLLKDNPDVVNHMNYAAISQDIKKIQSMKKSEKAAVAQGVLDVKSNAFKDYAKVNAKQGEADLQKYSKDMIAKGIKYVIKKL